MDDSEVKAQMASRMHQAIRTNSCDMVRTCLEAGADPNSSPALPLFFLEDAGSVGATQGRWAGVTTNSKQQRIIDDKEWFIAGSIACQISPLHMAMRNCFENKQLDRDEKSDKNTCSKAQKAARTIVELLVDNGADVDRACNELFVYNARGSLGHSGGKKGEVGQFEKRQAAAFCTPIDLVLFFKEYTWSHQHGASEFLDEVVGMLQKAAPVRAKHQMVQVRASALTMWKSMLFSETFSDVRFVCAEGEVLHAHKVVLAAGSEFWRTLFSERWHSSDGDFKTSHPAFILKAVLSFVYTGEICADLLDSNAQILVGVAHEYGLDELQQQSEQVQILFFVALSILSNSRIYF